MHFHTIFLSSSGLSFRLGRGRVAFGSLDDGCLYFLNHDRRSVVTTTTYDVLDDAMTSTVGVEQFLGVLASADKRGAVSWATRHRKKPSWWGNGVRLYRRSWRGLNGFLVRHGLNPVATDDSYTTGEAAKRVAAANPGLRVFT